MSGDKFWWAPRELVQTYAGIDHTSTYRYLTLEVILGSILINREHNATEEIIIVICFYSNVLFYIPSAYPLSHKQIHTLSPSFTPLSHFYLSRAKQKVNDRQSLYTA